MRSFFTSLKAKNELGQTFLFQIWYYSDYFFCLQMWNGLADIKKTNRLSAEEIKKQLLNR